LRPPGDLLAGVVRHEKVDLYSFSWLLVVVVVVVVVVVGRRSYTDPPFRFFFTYPLTVAHWICHQHETLT
jgi:hypothetical protein